VKKVGELLSGILNADMTGKAREFSRLFSLWEQLTAKHGIAAAAAHSQIQDIQRGILLVGVDHPGWIQIFQTKEHLLLSDLQKSFPELGINGLAFMLGKAPPVSTEPEIKQIASENLRTQAGGRETETEVQDAATGLDRIKNASLREKLKKLEETVRLNEGTKKGGT
jgi:hypothetical protein